MKLDKEYISKIISDYLLGIISNEDHIVLDNWLKDSYNKKIFDKISDANFLNRKIEKYNRFDKGKAWDKISRETLIETQSLPKVSSSNHFRIRKVYKYAALIFIALGISMLLVIKNNNRNTNILANIDNNPQEIILTTSEGEITIGNKDTTLLLNNVNLSSNTQQISYSLENHSENAILEYNEIRIPKGATYKILLSDSTIVWLNSKTALKFPINFVGKTRDVYLVDGEAYFNVSKDATKPFIVHFKKREIRVLGTKFNVKSYKNNENDYITLVEGSIKLNSGVNEVLIKPNEQVVVSNKINQISLKSVDANIFTLWRDNVYIYRDTSIQNLFNDISRDFDITIVYQDKELKDKRLSLKVDRNKSLESIVSAIAKASHLKIFIRGKVLTITN